MSALSLDPGKAAKRTTGWLLECLRASPRLRGPALLDALALAHICGRLRPESSNLLSQALQPHLHGGPALGLSTAEIGTAMFAAGTLLRESASEARQTAEDYLSVLDELAPPVARTSNEALLRLLVPATHDPAEGPAFTPPRASQPELSPFDPHLFRTGASGGVEQVVQRIECETRFGHERRSTAGIMPQLLGGFTLHALSKYDLPLGLRCLRCLVYLGDEGSYALRAGAEFLRLSQRHDGSFGDYDGAIAGVSRERTAREAELGVKLPIALQSLWTMAELSPRARGLALAPLRLATPQEQAAG